MRVFWVLLTLAAAIVCWPGLAQEPRSATVPPFRVEIVPTPEQQRSEDKTSQDAAHHDALDLEAQQKAADAAMSGAETAERALLPTWIQAILAVAGTILLVIAAVYSVRTYRLTTRTSRAQLRAYLSVATTQVTLEVGKQPTVFAAIKNSGQTPASDVNLSIRSRFATAGHEDEEIPVPKQEFVSRSILGPGLEVKSIMPIPVTFTGEMDKALADGTGVIAVAGRCEYVDVFGSRRLHEFKAVYGGKYGRNADGVMYMYSETEVL